MDPFTMMMLVNAGSNVLGSVMGQQAANQASEVNSEISEWQMRDQGVKSMLQMLLQKRAQDEIKLGTTDAQGTRTHFVPGVGQVTELGAGPAAAQAAAQANQQYDLSAGEQMRRAMRERESKAALDESNYADRLMSDMTRTVTPDSRDVRNQSMAAGASARTAGMRDAMEAQALQSNRRGGGADFGDAMSKMAENSARAYQSDRASIGTPAASRNLSPDTANLMGAMRARASGGAGSAVLPQISVPGGDTRGTGPTGMAPTIGMPMVSPDYGPANMITQLGRDVSGGMRDYYANQQIQQILNQQGQQPSTGVASGYFATTPPRSTSGPAPAGTPGIW